MLIDLHVHSSISPCSNLEMRDILGFARRMGLDGVCITDHDTMDARHDVREGVQKDGLLLVIGMEYATPQGDYLIFGPFEELSPGMSATEMLRLVHEADGAAVVAHPCRKLRPAAPDVAQQGLVHCVEAFNGRNTVEENSLAATWHRRFKLPATGGSDAHTLEELGGYPTRFDAPISSRSELVTALRRGACAPAHLTSASLHPGTRRDSVTSHAQL